MDLAWLGDAIAPTDQPINRTAEQPNSRSTDQPINRSTDQPINRSTDQPNSRTAEQPNSRTAEQPSSRTAPGAGKAWRGAGVMFGKRAGQRSDARERSPCRVACNCLTCLDRPSIRGWTVALGQQLSPGRLAEECDARAVCKACRQFSGGRHLILPLQVHHLAPAACANFQASSAMGRARAADFLAFSFEAVPVSTRLAMPCKMAAMRNMLKAM